MKIPLIYNPNARSSKLVRINKWINKHREELEVTASESPEHMYKLVASYAAKGAKVVAVAGGDGTLGMAAKALLGTETALAIVPSGTVNVFARELGIFDVKFTRAWEAIKNGVVKEVDLFKANGTLFLQMAGLGIDARAIELTSNDQKRKIGPLAYVLGGLKAFMERQPQVTVRINEGEKYQGIAVIFGNGKKYGGSFNIFSHASHCDGKIDIVIFKDKWDLLFGSVKALLRGGFRNNKKITYIQADGCQIEKAENIPFETDGDLAGHTLLTITLLQEKLKVMVLP